MTRTFLFLLFGLAGIAVLVSLGVWQMQRLAWKEGVLAEIEARITAPPVPLPAAADPEADKYLPVEMTGTFGPGVAILGTNLIDYLRTGQQVDLP